MILNTKRKNPWQGPPLTHFETVFAKKERIIEELQPNQVRLTFKAHDSLQKAGADYIKLRFELNEQV